MSISTGICVISNRIVIEPAVDDEFLFLRRHITLCCPFMPWTPILYYSQLFNRIKNLNARTMSADGRILKYKTGKIV